MTTEHDKITGSLFGGLWKSLTDEQFNESVALFTKRACANNFDLGWIRGKKCLDAGCGSGRSSVALALHGASLVTAVDISNEGIKEAKRRSKKISNIIYKKASVLDLPFANCEFDFIWCAGVIHHTENFNKALHELNRVLRPGGKLFLLVYGKGGLRWKFIKALRSIVRELGLEFLNKAIKAAGLPENNRKHFLDDLFVPIQKLSGMQEMKKKLIKLGFNSIKRWEGDTFDHENSIELQLDDMKKLDRIAAECVKLSTSGSEKYLSCLLKEISNVFICTAKKAISDSSLEKNELKKIIIGEGNLRILAQKAKKI